MRTPTLQEQIQAAALPQRPPVAKEDLLSDPRMERIRREAPEKYAELVARADPDYRRATVRPQADSGLVSPKENGDLGRGLMDDPDVQKLRRTNPERFQQLVEKAIPLSAPSEQQEVPYTWEDVQARPWFGELNAREREQAREDYFNRIVAPSGIETREEFDARTAPGFFERTGEAFGGSMQTMLGQAEQTIGYVMGRMGDEEGARRWFSSGRRRIAEGQGEAIDLPHDEDGWRQVLNIPTSEFVQKMLGEFAPQSAPYMVGAAGGGAGGAAVGTALGGPPGGILGFIIGSFLGSAGVVGAQRIGTAYDEYKRAHPDASDEEASEAALKKAGLEATIEGVAAPLGLVGRSLSPLRHAAVQAAIQSTHGAASQAASNVQEGQSPTRGLATAAAGEIFLDAPALTAAARTAVRPGADVPTPTPPPGEPGAPPLQVLPPGGERLALPQTIPFRQGAPEARPGLPSPENLEEGAAVIYNDLLGQGMSEPEARAEVQRRIRAYRELRQARTIEVPAEEDLQPGEVVEVEEQPGAPAVQGIVAEITPEGMARIQVLSEDAAGQDFLSWVRSGMMGDLPTAEQIARYPGEPAPPEQDAWRIVDRGTQRELGSTLTPDAANELAAQFDNAEVLPPRGQIADQGQFATQEPAGAIESPAQPSGQVQPDLAAERAQGQQITADLSPLARQVEQARAEPRTQEGTSLQPEPAAEPVATQPDEGTPAGDITFERNLELALPGLQRRANRLAGDPDRGADLLQDAMTRMWERRETYNPGEPFMPWAQTVLRSVHANRARTFSRRAEGNLDFGAEAADLAVAPEQEARFDLEMEARESGDLDVEAPQRGARQEKPPAAEGRTQDAARQPAGQQQPEAPTDLSRAPLSEIAEQRAALERQRRLEALAAQGRTGLSNADRAQARQRADALRMQIEQLDEAAKESEARTAQQVMAEARAIYAHEPPMLRLVNALESRAAGEYQAAKRMVTVSLEALDPVGTYNHEAMHDLRRWFLQPLENQALNSAFAPGSRASQEVMRTLRSLGYNEAAAQAAGSTEERIAHAFSLRRMGQFKPRPAVRRVLDKIGEWMERIANLFAGRGFRSAEDVFRAIERGEVGARQRRDSGVQAPSRQESRAPLSAPRGEKTNPRGPARRIKVPRREGEAATLGARAEEFQRNATARPLEDVLDYTVGRNTTRLNWPSENINRAIAEWRRLTPENQRTTTWDETIRQAEKRLRTGDITEQSIMDWPEKKVPSAVEVAAGDILLSLRAEHLMKVARQAAQTGSKEDAARYHLFSAEFAYMQGKVHGAASEVARALNIMKARPALLLDRTRAIRSIIEEAGGQDKLLETAEAVAALDEPEAIKKFMEKKWNPTWWDRLMEVWINGILSNPTTHNKNILGTRAFDDIVQNFDTLVAAGLGRLRGATDRVYAGEVAAGLYAELRAIPEAWKLAKHAYLTEEGPAHLSTTGKQEGVRKAIAHPLGKHLFRQSGRFLFGEDIFAKALAYRKSLMQQAYRQASKDGLRGQERAARIEKILENPSPELLLAAMDYADYVTFTRKAGPLAQAVMKLVDSVDIAGAKPLKLILPFIRTPAQLIDVAIEHSPAAAVLKQVREDLKQGGQARDVAMARIIVGSSLLGTAFLLAGAGLLTGSGPADPREKEMWRLGGSPLRPGVRWQPNSMWTGTRYMSIAGLDPIALPLGLAATFVETGERATTDEEDGIAGRLLGAFVKNVASKTWLQGITDAIEVMNDPDRYGEHWVRRMAGSVVPAGVAQAARMIDPNLREVETMMDAVRSRTPGWSKTLSPRINVKGEEIELQGAMGPDAFSPFYYAPEGRTGPVARELTALGITIGPSSQKINGHELTGKQLAEYRADRGARIWKRLEMTVNRPGWSTLSPDQKQRRIERAISFEGSAASGRMKHRYPELRRPKRLARGA